MGRFPSRGFIFLTVLGLFLSAQTLRAEDIRDVRPPVAWPGFPGWGLLGGLLLLLAVAGMGWLWKRRQGHRPQAPLRPPAPPWETALERLQALKARDLAGQGRVKDFFSELSDIIRRYMEQRFVVKAPEMTTEEFLSSLKDKDFLSAGQKAALREFLTCCDLVKFAKYGSSVREMEQSFVSGKRLIEETRGTSEPEH